MCRSECGISFAMLVVLWARWLTAMKLFVAFVRYHVHGMGVVVILLFPLRVWLGISSSLGVDIVNRISIGERVGRFAPKLVGRG